MIANGGMYRIDLVGIGYMSGAGGGGGDIYDVLRLMWWKGLL